MIKRINKNFRETFYCWIIQDCTSLNSKFVKYFLNKLKIFSFKKVIFYDEQQMLATTYNNRKQYYCLKCVHGMSLTACFQDIFKILFSLMFEG